MRSLTPGDQHGYALTSFDGVFLSADRRFCEMVGREVTTLQRLSVLDITHASDRTRNHEALERLRVEGRPFEITKRYAREDGQIVLVRNHVSRLSDGVGPDRMVAAVELLRVGSAPADRDLLKLATLLRDDLQKRASSPTMQRLPDAWVVRAPQRLCARAGRRAHAVPRHLSNVRVQ